MPPSHACDACRRRKVKCDGIEPCGNCRISQIACAFSVVPARRRRTVRPLVMPAASTLSTPDSTSSPTTPAYDRDAVELRHANHPQEIQSDIVSPGPGSGSGSGILPKTSGIYHGVRHIHMTLGAQISPHLPSESMVDLFIMHYLFPNTPIDSILLELMHNAENETVEKVARSQFDKLLDL